MIDVFAGGAFVGALAGWWLCCWAHRPLIRIINEHIIGMKTRAEELRASLEET